MCVQQGASAPIHSKSLLGAKLSKNGPITAVGEKRSLGSSAAFLVSALLRSERGGMDTTTPAPLSSVARLNASSLDLRIVPRPPSYVPDALLKAADIFHVRPTSGPSNDPADEDASLVTAAAARQNAEDDKFNTTFIQLLQNGRFGSDFVGMLHLTSADSSALQHFTHQREAALLVARPDVEFLLAWHDCGSGKTVTAILSICALSLQAGEDCPAICVMPAAACSQFHDMCRSWINRDKRHIVWVTESRQLSEPSFLDGVVVLVMSAQMLMNLTPDNESTTGHAASKKRRLEKEEQLSDEARPAERKKAADKATLVAERNEVLCGGPAGKGWKLLVLDEVHKNVNPTAGFTLALNSLSQHCEKRLALTGTLAAGKPDNMRGISVAGNVPPIEVNGETTDFQADISWCTSNDNIDTATTKLFMAHYVHRAKNVVPLPPVQETVFTFNASVPPDLVSEYNDYVAKASSTVSADRKKLLNTVHSMQQFLVSPVLARATATGFRNQQERLMKEALAHPTGSMKAIVAAVRRGRADGHRRIIIAAERVACLSIARAYIEQQQIAPNLRCFSFFGGLSAKQRAVMVEEFLGRKSGYTDTILFLSMRSGGFAINMVPGCNLTIFWGAMTWTPADRDQTKGRTLRLGQKADVVKFWYILAYGSVDASITTVWSDKQNFAQYLDGLTHDASGAMEDRYLKGELPEADDEEEDRERDLRGWRRCDPVSRICKALQPDGNFPPMPEGTSLVADAEMVPPIEEEA